MREPYANIREILGSFIGKRIVDITQHDEEEFRAGEESYVMLLFDDGNFLKFPVTDLGFEHSEEKPAARAVPGEEVAGKEECVEKCPLCGAACCVDHSRRSEHECATAGCMIWRTGDRP